MCLYRLTRVAVLVLCLVTAIARSPAAASDTCGGCTPLGLLNVDLSSIDPPEPMVGDEVTVTYSYAAQLPGGFDCNGSFPGSCTLVGGEPFLAGDEPPTVVNGEIVVRRTVVEAGIATIRLDASAQTELECFFEDPELGCIRDFEPGFLDVSSAPFELELLPALTQSDNDGCAIGPRPKSSDPLAVAAIIAPVLLLSRLRRRSPGKRSRAWRATFSQRSLRTPARRHRRSRARGCC